MDIHIQDLWFTYPNGVDALRGVSLKIDQGARLALLGQNGAGKTTLVKHLNGLLKPTRGTVRIGEWDTRANTIAQLARRVGFVFQNPDQQLFKTRVWDEVAFGPTNLRSGRTEIERRVNQALERCGLAELADAHPYDLPIWQRRWIGIASVLAMDTPIVILDEPTTGQDALGLARLADLIADLSQRGVTVIVVTHDVDFAAENFSDLIVMAGGQVIARGTPEIFSQANLLSRAALDAPQLVRLAHELGWAETPAKVSEFLEIYRKRHQH